MKRQLNGIMKLFAEIEAKRDELYYVVSEVKSEAEDKFSELSERAQEGPRGERLQAIIDALDGLEQEIGEIEMAVSNANSAIEEAMQA